MIYKQGLFTKHECRMVERISPGLQHWSRREYQNDAQFLPDGKSPKLRDVILLVMKSDYFAQQDLDAL